MTCKNLNSGMYNSILIKYINKFLLNSGYELRSQEQSYYTSSLSYIKKQKNKPQKLIAFELMTSFAHYMHLKISIDDNITFSFPYNVMNVKNKDTGWVDVSLNPNEFLKDYDEDPESTLFNLSILHNIDISSSFDGLDICKLIDYSVLALEIIADKEKSFQTFKRNI